MKYVNAPNSKSISQQYDAILKIYLLNKNIFLIMQKSLYFLNFGRLLLCV